MHSVEGATSRRLCVDVPKRGFVLGAATGKLSPNSALTACEFTSKRHYCQLRPPPPWWVNLLAILWKHTIWHGNITTFSLPGIVYWRSRPTCMLTACQSRRKDRRLCICGALSAPSRLEVLWYLLLYVSLDGVVVGGWAGGVWVDCGWRSCGAAIQGHWRRALGSSLHLGK